MADAGLYSVKLHGEKGVYELRGSESHSLRIMCELLSDLTGYKDDHLRNKVLRNMKISEKRQVTLANSASWPNDRPTFFVTRVG